MQENRKVQPQGGHPPQLPHQAGQSQGQHLTAPGQVLFSPLFYYAWIRIFMYPDPDLVLERSG